MSAAPCVRQDQDVPGDVNLLLSPLTLAFAGADRHLREEVRFLQPAAAHLASVSRGGEL